MPLSSHHRHPFPWILVFLVFVILASTFVSHGRTDLVQNSPDAILPDGSVYHGDLADQRLHGTGKLSWGNGDVYTGGFQNGLMHGTGTFSAASGEQYEGEFEKGYMSGKGSLTLANGSHYQGGFKFGDFDGYGELSYSNGDIYKGQFKQGMLHGQGNYSDTSGAVYSGIFKHDELSGFGIHRDQAGNFYYGEFKSWEYHGSGKYVTAGGDTYKGHFSNGILNGAGSHLTSEGDRYEGPFKDWSYDGKGEMFYQSGDHYSGEFQYSLPHGKGKMTYKEPKLGIIHHSGEWEYGQFAPALKEQRAKSAAIVETVLYNQNQLLEQQLEQLTAGEDGRVELFYLGIGGYGQQDVFLKEVTTIKQMFDDRFNTGSRTVQLINNTNSPADYPLATITSIKRALTHLEKKMNLKEDILFLYMTSHGSKEHRFSLSMKGLSLADIDVNTLVSLLDESNIKWRVIVISSCYSGGFVDPLSDSDTLIMTASAKDRKSFGCSDENDMTDFAKAYFQKSLPETNSFEEAFEKTYRIIETEEKANKIKKSSLPQIAMGDDIREQLAIWRRQMH